MLLRIIETELEFVAVASLCDRNQIYNIFSGEVYASTKIVICNELRDKLVAQYASKDTPEPCRATLFALGMKYNVRSLIDY